MSYPSVTGLEICGYVVDAVPCDCPSEYATQVIARIEGLTAPLTPEHFGKIHLTKISLSRAHHDGVSLTDICRDDGRFALLHWVFDSSGVRPKEDRGIDSNWTDLLIFSEMQIKRKFRTKAVVVRAIETVIAYLGPQSLVVAVVQRGSGLDLTPAERRALGFKEISFSPYVIRGPGWRSPRARAGRQPSVATA
jgi:hypothetical protein